LKTRLFQPFGHAGLSVTARRIVGTAIIVILVAIIAAGSLIVWSKYCPGHSIEITLAPDREIKGEIYVTGQVNNPGLYPLTDGDNLADIIRAAGGTTDNADIDHFELNVPALGTGKTPQKVNINRAEAWLLEALPGIGAVRAQAIIDYRRQNGPFHSTAELAKVAGIGTDIYEKIKDLITVAD
jgi:competence protein ComEA